MAKATETSPGQIALIPDKPIKFEFEIIPLADLPPDEELTGGAPCAALRDDVARNGVHTPILVTGEWDGHKVMAGRRRIKAARMAGLETIPALVAIDNGWNSVHAAVVSISDHATRKENAAQELRDIKTLLATGATETDIQKVTGLPKSRIRAVAKLGHLVPSLRTLLDTGAITESTASEAARLPRPVQEALVERYTEKGRLTYKDVDAVRTERNHEALGVGLAGLPSMTLRDDPHVAMLGAARRAAQELARILRQMDGCDRLAETAERISFEL